jgi:hypothetical protein
MAKYQKVCVTNHAKQFKFIDGPNGTETIRLAVELGLVRSLALSGDFSQWELETLEGWKAVNDGDYIITGVDGEKYPRPAYIFHQTYEPVEGRKDYWKKKPIVVDAIQWNKQGDHPDDDRQLLTDSEGEKFFSEGKVVRYFIHPYVNANEICKHCQNKMCMHGWIDEGEDGFIVCPGDYVITGVANEHYPCKPDIFAKTYIPLDIED